MREALYRDSTGYHSTRKPSKNFRTSYFSLSRPAVHMKDIITSGIILQNDISPHLRHVSIANNPNVVTEWLIGWHLCFVFRTTGFEIRSRGPTCPAEICKGGRCVGLTTLPPSRPDCLGILGAPNSWNPQGLARPVQWLLNHYLHPIGSW